MKVFYSRDYVSAGYAFDTTRKAEWIVDSLIERPIKGIELVEPQVVSHELLSAVHTMAYINAVRTGEPLGLAESQGFEWDANLWPTVLASNGGVVAAARAALADGLAGSLSSGLHHARADRGAGFCTFNGLVMAAKAALSEGAQSVLILDLDAHCGGGTASLIQDDARIAQTDISVSVFDSYSASDRISLAVVTRPQEYLPTLRARLKELQRADRKIDLCIYNAGMDPHEDCSTGGLRGITAGMLQRREQTVFEWCAERQVPVAFVLAGGYVSTRLEKTALVELHRLTLEAAVGLRRQRRPISPTA